MRPTKQLNAVRELYEAALPAGRAGTLEERRAGYESLLSQLPLDDRSFVTPQIADGVITGYWVDGSGQAQPERSALMLHGGGYVIGSARGYLSLASRIAARTRALVFVPEYPLAPENPFPGAIHAVREAWALVTKRGEQHFLVGDSAGGGLALALACTLRDSGNELPAGISLMSPLTDLRATSDTYELNSGLDPVCSRQGIQRVAELYLEGANPHDFPLGSPLLADLSGLPPMHVHVGTHEVLLGDSTSLAAAVARAGGTVTLRVKGEMVHVWPLFWAQLEEGLDAIEEIAEFFDEVTRPAGRAMQQVRA